MEKDNWPRRAFIVRLILLSGSLLLLEKFLTPKTGKVRKILVSAARKEIPAGGALIYREARVALMNPEGEKPYALSLVCTHLGCLVTVNEENMECPCHGSVFDHSGRVLKGPAEHPLKRLPVEESDGILRVSSA